MSTQTVTVLLNGKEEEVDDHVNNKVLVAKDEFSTLLPHTLESGCPIYHSSSPTEILINYENLLKPKIEKLEGVPGAFLIHNVLSPFECQQFIDLSEKLGYREAMLSTYGGMVSVPEVRNNRRVIWQVNDSTILPIYERVKDLVPFTQQNGKWSLCGLNERLRFYRYDPTQEFKKHFDGEFPRYENEISFMSFILYLNEGMEGGHTTFYVKAKTIKVTPKIGTALIFMHGNSLLSPLHEGSPTKSGRKYVLRSDIMYKYKN